MTSPGSQSKNKNHKPGSLSLDYISQCWWLYNNRFHLYPPKLFCLFKLFTRYLCQIERQDGAADLTVCQGECQLLLGEAGCRMAIHCFTFSFFVSLSLSLFRFPFLSFFTSPLQNGNILSPITIYIKFVWFSHSFAQKSQSQNKNTTNLRQQSLCNLNGIKMFFDVNGIIFCQKFLFLIFAFQFCMFWNEFCILSRFKILPVWIIWMALNYWTTRHPRLALRIDKILTTLSNTWTLVESTHRNKFDMQTYFCHLKQS